MSACSFMWQTFVGFMVDMFRERERERKRIGKRSRAWENIHKEAKISDLQIFVTLFKAVPLLHLSSAILLVSITLTPISISHHRSATFQTNSWGTRIKEQ